MEQHANSQSPSNQGWTCAKAKTHHFPIFDLGGGWGSKFYFILSKTAIMDTIKWNSKNPNTPKSRWSFVTTKTRHFPIFDLLWGGSKFSIYFVPDCGCRSSLLKFHKIIWCEDNTLSIFRTADQNCCSLLGHKCYSMHSMNMHKTG